MSSPNPDQELPLPFETPEKLSDWLEKNHDLESALWVRTFKKKSGIKSVTWNEIVIECLRWGWIDGIKKSLDETAYLQRITPRRKGSIWSKRNTEHVEKLITEGRMEQSGSLQVEAAKANGRWENAYAPQSEMVVPDDLITILEGRPKAQLNFQALSKSSKNLIVVALASAKKPETRERRLNKFLDQLEENA